MNYKFRGRTAEGNWVYGYLMLNEKITYIIPEQSAPEIPNSCLIIKAICVLPETVGQWMGLKDKNGKEAYEGDYIKDEQDEGFISWSHSELSFTVKNKSGDEYLLRGFKNFEVVGNIHDMDFNETAGG